MSRFLGELFRIMGDILSLVVPGQRDRLRRRHMEDIYSVSEKDNALMNTQETGGIRSREVTQLGPMASSDGIAWDEDSLTFTDQDGTATRLVHKTVRRCDCGSFIGYGKDSSILGTCMVCGRIVCSRKGCGSRCERCGMLVCRRHMLIYKDHVFCTAHRFYAWWRLFWGYE